MSERPDWDGYFMEIARVVSLRATCPRAQIGAVIVSGDNRVLATGYNGAPAGEPHCEDVGCNLVDGHCTTTIHAEVNAVASAARQGHALIGSHIYVTGDRPICPGCANILKAAGVVWRMDERPEAAAT